MAGLKVSSPIDLLWLGSKRAYPNWSLGSVLAADSAPSDVHRAVVTHIERTDAQALLFWDSRLGPPNPEGVSRIALSPGDVWHAGLRLAMAGKPGIMDFLCGTWMLNRDPDPAIEATSWRLSLGACLVPTEVLRRIGGPLPEFRTLSGAALEMGHRYIRHGVLVRHVPTLVPESTPLPDSFRLADPIPLEDELRFAYYRFGSKWTCWAVMRAMLAGYAPGRRLIQAARKVLSEPRPPIPRKFHNGIGDRYGLEEASAVSVLIPTIDRYPYLTTLLAQLRHQTVRAAEIIVVDQTPRERRHVGIAAEFADLPLRMMYQDEPGQCTSRNAGLQTATGDYVMFLDDDDEVSADLIEKHLRSLRRYRADVSCGVVDEVGAGPLPEDFRLVRASDVFPTNNSLVRREVLRRSGLFDLAYNRGQRADGDLGMRVYQSGALMVLNPEILVLHHHAPAGGLRTHKARVVTYASSRDRLAHRHLPSATEIYLAIRYFTPRQIHESLLIRLLGTLSCRGGRLRRTAKVLLAIACFPDSLYRLRKAARQAKQMRHRFPDIPTLAAPADCPSKEAACT